MVSEMLSRAQAMASRMPKKPLIAIVGATGTGKSKLAVSLATKYNGEIINADAVQMYRGLPVVTNKLPEREQNGIPHHLLDCIDLDEQTWNAHKFVRESSRIVEEIRQRGKLPIVVGGTNYYVYGLLFLDAMLNEIDIEDENSTYEAANNEVKNTRFSILNEPTEVIMAKLHELDPVMASRWHPNERLKIRRSLEICLQTGQKASEIYDEQKQRRNNHPTNTENLESILRYDPLIFWLDAEDAILKRRLNDRVDNMVKTGLLEEVQEMQMFVNQREKGGLFKRGSGVWIAIGYKEMEPWLEAKVNLEENDKTLSQLQDTCVEAIKGGTRRYAKRQHRWIRIRLAKALDEAHAKNAMFLLDCTELANWESDVEAQSQTLLESFLRGSKLPEPESISSLASRTFAQIKGTSYSMPQRNAKVCDACQKIMMTESDWVKHLKSRSHEKAMAGQRKAFQQMNAREEAAIREKEETSS